MPRRSTKKQPRKERPPKPPAAPELPDHVIERVVLLLVTLRSRAEVLAECQRHQQLQLTEDQAAAAIDEASRRLLLAADYQRQHEFGQAMTRLRDIYSKASKQHDYKTALAAQREISKLTLLYRNGKDDDDKPDHDAELHDSIVAELAATRDHLSPLVNGQPDEAVDEIARRVVALFISR